MKKIRICITLSPETIVELKKVSKDKRISVSHLIELIWVEYFKKQHENN